MAYTEITLKDLKKKILLVRFYACKANVTSSLIR